MQKSESIKSLASALCEAQKVIESAPKTNENPFFKSKYADFASVWETCRPALVKNGFAVSQICINEGELVGVETILMHISGEWISNRLLLKPVKSDPQAQGSAITYARRYSLSGIVCLATEADDDAEGTMDRKTKPPIAPPQAKKAEAKAETTAETTASGDLSVKATIEKTSFKEGKKGNKAWTLYGILAGGTWYNTFDKKLWEKADINKGSEVEIVYQATERGNNLVAIICEDSGVIPDDCTSNPATCPISKFDEGGKPFCGDNIECQYVIAPKEETTEEPF